jgi:hypothetical protein
MRGDGEKVNSGIPVKYLDMDSGDQFLFLVLLRRGGNLFLFYSPPEVE